MKQAAVMLRMFSSLHLPSPVRGTKVIPSRRFFSTSQEEKTISIEQHRFDLLEKDSKAISQQLQALAFSMSNLDTKFANGLDSIRKDMKEENKSIRQDIINLDTKFTHDLDSIRKDMKEENKSIRQDIINLDSKFTNALKENRQEMKDENKALRQEMKDESKALRQEVREDFQEMKSKNHTLMGLVIALAVLLISYDQYYRQQNRNENKSNPVTEDTAKPSETLGRIASFFANSQPVMRSSNLLPRA